MKITQLSSYLLVMIVIVHLVTGCGIPTTKENKNSTVTPEADPAATLVEENKPVVQPPPEPFPPGIEPNEVGRVMILMYHQIDEPEGEWTRTPANFRRDLTKLYEAGYRLTSLNDFLDNNIKIPAGFSPVIITFDDGTQGQFNYLNDGDTIRIDPDSAVGILEEFYQAHPDFGLAATFYVYYGNPFGQPEYRQEKFHYLIEKGFEIGNHSYSHANLGQLSSADVGKELARHIKRTKEYLPDYEVRSLALPYGASPQERMSLLEGQYQGHTYRNDGILLVGAEPAPAPNRLEYDPYRLPRIRADGKELEKWLTYFANNPGERYISDGDPNTISVPANKEGLVDTDNLAGKELRIY